jgi:hypothetical protein
MIDLRADGHSLIRSFCARLCLHGWTHVER